MEYFVDYFANTKKMKKVILITGASSGMGKETARVLGRDGHIVYAAARRTDQMKDLREQGVTPLQMDITREADVQQVVDTIMAKEGRIDVLWNNAGYGLYGAVEDVPMDEARRQFEVNIFGLALLTQKVIPFMRKAGSGTIINTSSMGGKMYMPMGAWYHASKHALEGWSDSLRLDLQPFNIHVVVLEPGIIQTEWGGVMLNNMLEFSGKGVYAGMARRIAEALKKMNDNGQYSKSDVIADTIRKIIASPRPKTRYRVGAMAKPMVWMRVFLGDRAFDRIIMSQV